MKTRSLIVTTVLLVSSTCVGSAFAASNPHDAVGVEHNQYLDCLRQNRVPVDQMLDYLIGRCGYTPRESMDVLVEAFAQIKGLDDSVPLEKHLAPYRKQYSDLEFEFVRRIDRIKREAGSLEKAAEQYAQLEREAIAKLDLKSRGAAAVLVSLSVGRHSLAYWTRVEQEDRVGGSGMVTTARWGWGKVLAVVGADIAGAAITMGLGLAPAAGTVAAGASNAVSHGW